MSYATDWQDDLRDYDRTPPASVAEECARALDRLGEPLLGTAASFIPKTPTAHGALEARLKDRLRALSGRSRTDPSSNPIVALSVHIESELASGAMSYVELEQLIQRLVVVSFADRAERAQAYLGDVDPDATARRLAAGVRKFAAPDGVLLSFDEFSRAIGRACFGVVFTGHPTFAMTVEQSRLLAQLVAGRDLDGAPLSQEARAAIFREAAMAEHRPDPDLTLGIEHAWSMEALENAQTALDRINRIIFETARELYPDDWSSLSPRLMTLASWVGYDLDGRADITWRDTMEKRLLVKAAQLRRWEATVGGLLRSARGALAAALTPLRERLEAARQATDAQAASIGDLDLQSDPGSIASFGRLMVGTHRDALSGTDELREMLGVALDAATDDETRLSLLVLRASFCGQGLGLAHTHVRLNASQIHNAIRSQIGLHGSPSDPAYRRSYVNVVSDLLARSASQTVSYGSIIGEHASARRLFLTVVQMLKHVDGQTPVRFLIAETESSFTLLAALYFARLFGLENRIEISPLFETAYALEHGDLIVDEALKNPHYRAYVEGLGRIAVQVGFSDSGRYLGQMAATFLIERLQLRLAQVLKRHGLTDIQLILFNTHGESIGRGAHPVTLADRLDYLLPDASRAAFAKQGITLKEEVSFQGGDGYVWFMHPATSFATLTTALDHVLLSRPDVAPDPIYDRSDYAAEYFTTVAQFFGKIVDDPDYASLLSVFGTNFVYKSGSRPVKRQVELGAAPAELTHPSQLRAIPNNAVLQQLGFLANVVSGNGAASAKDPESFARMRRESPRFRRAMAMVEYAMSVSDPRALSAYIASIDPAFALDKAGRVLADGGDPAVYDALLRMSRALETFDRHGKMIRVYRTLYRDYLALKANLDLSRAPGEKPVGLDVPSQETVALLHAIRIALIQRLWLTAMDVPAFSPQLGATVDSLIQQVLRLDAPEVVGRLKQIFPLAVAPPHEAADFGEQASYRGESERTYAREHVEIFNPMERIFQLIQRLGTAVTYQIGAVG
ncbi:MAG: phosphoenolpyruvate carboxylase [Bauldia sp.]|nr:phosphoenolpyruvate carboxylase [Bauldia sp.]